MRKNVRHALGAEKGAFDLPSILVGVVVVGILVAGVLASIFGVIPFAQNKGAQQDLDAIRTAQGTMKAKDGAFGNRAALAGSGYVSLPDSAVVDSDGKGFCASVTSQSGKKFRITSDNSNAQTGSCTKVTTWAKTALPDYDWMASAVPQDARTIVVVGSYAAKISKDKGATWTDAPIGATASWETVSMSGDGRTIAVAGNPSFLWVSKDSRATWSPKSTNQFWRSVAVSRDGSAIAAVGRSGPVASVDGGATWQAVPIAADDTWTDTWHTAWVSPDGNRLMMATSHDLLAVSSDRGKTWHSLKASTTRTSGAMSASDDGKTIAIGEGSWVLVSSDSGATWTEHQVWMTLNLWVSPDGKRIVRGDGQHNRPETSLDGGNTWTEDNGIDGGYWRVSGNADGSTLVAVSYGGTVWVGHYGYEQ